MIRVIRAELYKLRTTPGPWVIVGVTLAISGLFILIPFGMAGGDVGQAFAAPHTQQQLRNLLGVGIESAEVLAPILGVLCITGEYRHKVLTTSLLMTPRRVDLLVAKGVACVVWGIYLFLVSLFMVAAMGIPWLVAEGGSVSALLHQAGAVLPGLLGCFVLFTLFGLGFGTLVRNQVAGVLLTVGITLVIEGVLVAVFSHLLHINLNWLPSPAADALSGGIFGMRGQGFVLLAWWQGGLALLAWGVVPAVIGYFTTLRRDVT
jgi:hypothetical protein